MAKRQLIIDGYETAENGLWTLSYCKIIKANQVQNFVSVPGRYAPLDFSTTLTDGLPYYANASLEAVLESSEGTRDERQERIELLVNAFDGHTVQIVHPDHPEQYMVGRVQVSPEYNDLVHCAVRLTAICEPWFYNAAQTVVTKTLTSTAQTVYLPNAGALGVTPRVDVTGQATLVQGTLSQVLSAGSYQIPWLHLTPGAGPLLPKTHEVRCSGTGKITFTYREAVLAV